MVLGTLLTISTYSGRSEVSKNNSSDELTLETVWPAFESAARGRLQNSRSDLPTDILDVIEELLRLEAITSACAQFLHSMRKGRNISAHRSTGTSGKPLFTPTAEALAQLRWYTDDLARRRRVADVMKPAETCALGDKIADVVTRMHQNDFDYLPYKENDEWLVFSRWHLVSWLEIESSTCTGDELRLTLSATVSDIVHLTGKKRPIMLSKRAYLTEAVEKLNSTLSIDTSDDTAPMIIATSKDTLPLVFTTYDLPAALALLTPPH
jgi:hypothetical protein